MNNTTALRLLSDVQYATVATVNSDGTPWNTPVFCVYDSQQSIYWSSHPDSCHSQNIEHSSKVFIVIYNSKAGEGEGVGLYAQATAKVVNDEPEIKLALDLLGERRGKPFKHVEKFIGDGPQRIYKAMFEKCWINDADQDADGDFIRDYRVEVE